MSTILEETKFLINKYHIKANKSFGQNFLINEKTIDFLSRHGQNNSIPYIAEGNDFVCKYYLSAERKAAYDNGGNGPYYRGFSHYLIKGDE